MSKNTPADRQIGLLVVGSKVIKSMYIIKNLTAVHIWSIKSLMLKGFFSNHKNGMKHKIMLDFKFPKKKGSFKRPKVYYP